MVFFNLNAINYSFQYLIITCNINIYFFYYLIYLSTCNTSNFADISNQISSSCKNFKCCNIYSVMDIIIINMADIAFISVSSKSIFVFTATRPSTTIPIRMNFKPPILTTTLSTDNLPSQVRYSYSSSIRYFG